MMYAVPECPQPELPPDLSFLRFPQAVRRHLRAKDGFTKSSMTDTGLSRYCEQIILQPRSCPLMWRLKPGIFDRGE